MKGQRSLISSVPRHAIRRPMTTELLTTSELAKRIKYDARTIRNQLKDTVFIEGVHYIRPFGRRKILFIWDVISKDIFDYSKQNAFAIPLANGGAARG